jgi:DNA polymerase III subunit epsilon
MESARGNILVFDVETTGTDKQRDQIIELCVKLGVDGAAPTRTWRILPDVPISPGAEAVHGISMADLEGFPRFGGCAAEIRELFEEAEVLIGYNLSFDIDMLQEEFSRLGQPPLDLAGKKIVDAFRLWQQCEPRSLQDAHRRFVGEDFEAAHSAEADVEATGRVLRGMLAHFDLDRDWGTLASVCEPERALWIGPSRHVQWGDGESPVLGFGKHRGRPLLELARGRESNYLCWIIDKDFPSHVREICRRALELPREEFLRWVVRTFGQPPLDPPAIPTADQPSAP